MGRHSAREMQESQLRGWLSPRGTPQCVVSTTFLSPWIKSSGVGGCVCIQDELGMSSSREVAQIGARGQGFPVTSSPVCPGPK